MSCRGAPLAWIAELWPSITRLIVVGFHPNSNPKVMSYILTPNIILLGWNLGGFSGKLLNCMLWLSLFEQVWELDVFRGLDLVWMHHCDFFQIFPLDKWWERDLFHFLGHIFCALPPLCLPNVSNKTIFRKYQSRLFMNIFSEPFSESTNRALSWSYSLKKWMGSPLQTQTKYSHQISWQSIIKVYGLGITD